MQDVREEKNIIDRGSVAYPIEKISLFIEKYNYNCNGSGKLIFDGQDKRRAAYVVYGPGWTQANPYLIVDFFEDNGTSSYFSYSVYKTWKTHSDDLIGIIEREGACKKN